MADHIRTINGLKNGPSQSFPDRPQFSGFMKPCRFEGEVGHLEVTGKIPLELDGTFYRVMPDPQFPPMNDDDPVCPQELDSLRNGCVLSDPTDSGSTAMAMSALFVSPMADAISSKSM